MKWNELKNLAKNKLDQAILKVAPWVIASSGLAIGIFWLAPVFAMLCIGFGIGVWVCNKKP
ncbi:hypothetical protein [Alteromonas mediterranea]|uniref:Uncharacterized protein n=1 Tax=Alteromonas mediterranea (strain DSM 17117 / CIP 110805 / LMG 28347 / Deep ecotype) TaxID=1774373 RepID=F2GCE2_ALTMD|nr:hypothetical protein [Alteromonas mediterranea]AEA99098.1 hypothetical protein MADE_1014820 [Alteromonas mediterranea DE]